MSKRLSLTWWSLVWCVWMTLWPGVVWGETMPEEVVIEQRTAGYSLKKSQRIMGYFPAGSTLKVIDVQADGWTRVHFVSPSGKVTEALCRSSELGLVAPAALRSNDPDSVWDKVREDEFDRVLLTERARLILNGPGWSWRHAQTDHFVFHFEHGIFARKVARMAEFMYRYIAADVQGLEDRMEGRSHVFVFKDGDRWKLFQEQAGPSGMEWAFSMVHGPVMYLQRAESRQSSGGVLAHEMTHLILNRFFPSQPPRWLNEGLAEWYGEFGYAAFKGVKKSKRAPFKQLKHPYDLPLLLSATEYPSDPALIHAYYETAKFMVGYLRLKHPDQKFMPFLREMISGGETLDVLGSYYEIQGMSDLVERFEKFAH